MKKRKKQRKTKNQIKVVSTETHTAFNTRLLFITLMFFVFSFLAYCCIKDREFEIGVVFGILALLPIFIFLISPLYMVFSYREIKIVYVLGQTEIINRLDIRSIVSFGGFLSKSEPFPYYVITYPKSKKLPFFVNGEIPKTLKTKKLIKKYYKDKLL